MQYAHVKRMASEFWEAAGGSEGFPRHLEPAVLRTLPLAVVKIPLLRVSGIQTWAVERGIQIDIRVSDRPLHGCLLAYQGKGIVLINGTSSVEEQAFSLAHEVAHFLLNYLIPRRRAVEKLGMSVLEVFDGIRSPTIAEKTQAVLSRINIGFHIHLMDRGSDGSLCDDAIYEIEDEVECLAIELLAPEDEVRQCIQRTASEVQKGPTAEMASKILANDFGIPADVAVSYGQHVVPLRQPAPVREWLRQRDKQSVELSEQSGIKGQKEG
ncbi:MAG: ImmA/IrrE family metallo-endopeptidase [Anaerolineae bacterium]|nr:ImmA/IrrE family metallo-endopeptidase [Anaerolineae bacterium]